jgi:FtsH-binding integral membrane protein
MFMAFERSYLHLLILSGIVLIHLIKNNAFTNGKPTCDNFILNVYLYLAFSIVAVGLSCYIYNYYLNGDSDRNKYLPIAQTMTSGNFGIYIIISYLICFGLIFYLSFSESFGNKKFKSIHVFWLLFLFLISSGVYPYFKSLEYKDIIEDSILITSSIFAVMSAIVFMFPDFFDKTYNFMTTGLLVSLLIIIIFELGNAFFNRNLNSLIKNFKMTSYAVVVLFTLFVSYDTQRMIMLKEMCSSLPNYPKFSLDFFLDILNIFKRIVLLKSLD